MDIPSDVLQFRLSTAHRRCAFKNQGVFVRYNSKIHIVPGASGIPPSHEGLQRGDLRSDLPFDYYSFRKTKSVQCGRQDKDSNPIKFPLDKRGVWGYTYHNGICPCEIRRKRTVPPMGVVEAQRMESPGYRPCRILRIK